MNIICPFRISVSCYGTHAPPSTLTRKLISKINYEDVEEIFKNITIHFCSL